MFELGKHHEKLQSVHLHFLITALLVALSCLHCTDREWWSLTDRNDQSMELQLGRAVPSLSAGEGWVGSAAGRWQCLCPRHCLWHCSCCLWGLWGAPCTPLMGKELQDNFVPWNTRASAPRGVLRGRAGEEDWIAYSNWKFWRHFYVQITKPAPIPGSHLLDLL